MDIYKKNLKGNSIILFSQSSLRIHHYNNFKHVYELFKPYLSKSFNLKERTFKDKRTNKIYSSISFKTLSLPCFNHYKTLFYISEILKIVPSNIKDLLTPRGLAYCIMDDGSLGLHLNTYGFTSKDVLNLKIP